MDNELIGLTNDDLDLVVFLASAKPCSLAVKPGDDDNWIERAGGKLPNYACVVAKGVMRSGKTRSAAIAIAISRMKKWAAGVGDVNADTRAKAAKALAQWEALKAKNKAKKLVKASNEFGEDYIILSNVESYSLDNVRRAWDAHMAAARRQLEAITPGSRPIDMPYSYVMEVYTDFIIVEQEGPDRPIYRIAYEVIGDVVTFATPERVKLQYVNADDTWVLDTTRY